MKLINKLRYYTNRIITYLPFIFKVILLRLKGINLPFLVKIASNAQIVGKVAIKADSIIERDVLVKGNIQIGVGVTIEKNVILKGEIRIADNVKIERGSQISGNISIASNSLICRDVQMTGNIKIGSNTIVGRFTLISTMNDAQFIIGDDVLINDFSTLGASKQVIIKNHCIFAAYVHITDASHGMANEKELIKHAIISACPVLIEENVWLGSAVMVMKGVTVGKGSVIGAKSLVNKSIPPYSIAYGTPAKVVKNRKI